MAANFMARVQEIYDSSTPNLIWEVGTSVKVLRGYLTGFGPDYIEMQVPIAGPTPMIVVRQSEITYICRGSTAFDG